jgi:hypothetical protein
VGNLGVAATASEAGEGKHPAMSHAEDQGGGIDARQGSEPAGGAEKPPRRTLTPEQVTRGMEIDPTEVRIFRGGDSLLARVGVDIQVDEISGFVKPTHGLSLDLDATALQRFGGAFLVESIPPELRIVQRGKRLGHFEIVSRQAVTPERFQELVNQVKLIPAEGQTT